MVTSRGYRHIFGTFNEFCMHIAELPQDDLAEWCIGGGVSEQHNGNERISLKNVVHVLIHAPSVLLSHLLQH